MSHHNPRKLGRIVLTAALFALTTPLMTSQAHADTQNSPSNTASASSAKDTDSSKQAASDQHAKPTQKQAEGESHNGGNTRTDAQSQEQAHSKSKKQEQTQTQHGDEGTAAKADQSQTQTQNGGSAKDNQSQALASCEVDRRIKFAGMAWESQLILANVQRFIVEHGYACDAHLVPANTMTGYAALGSGGLDVITEVWFNSHKTAWEKLEAKGKVTRTKPLFHGREGWYIPKYTVQRYPDLKTAAQLPKYKDKFVNRKDDSKGLMIGCPAAWECHTLIQEKATALGLDDSFTMFSPGSAMTESVLVNSSYRKKKDIIFYYWEPTPLIARLDVVPLSLVNADKGVDVNYPRNPVFSGLNGKFAAQAPQLKAFFDNMHISFRLVNQVIDHMKSNSATEEETAIWFLKTHSDLWKKWMPPVAAARVSKALEAHK